MSRYLRAVCLVILGCTVQSITHTQSKPYTDALKKLDMDIPVRLLIPLRSSSFLTPKDTVGEMNR